MKQTDLTESERSAPSVPLARPSSIDARLAALELQIASQAFTIDALQRTLEDLADVTKRAVTRLDAASRGIKLGRPVGSRGTATRPSPVAARDAADLGFDGSAHRSAGVQSETLPGIAEVTGLRGTDESILECLSEVIMNLFVTRNVPSVVISIQDLEGEARVYQAELERGWPFSSRKHFARRVTMFAEQLLGFGVRATRMRTSHGKIFWRFEQLAADGMPIAILEPAAPEPGAQEHVEASRSDADATLAGGDRAG